ncbi:hypothetical protein ACOI1C_10090 [Bacillus sp. DJP31]|uniref:hypothetical protein n=1 Tax=Bacillus sp. DJP31 TaxID=3409789 RepID=UPI003BB5C2B9
MVELKLRNIMKQLKSKDPSKRYEALDKLNEYKLKEGLEIQIDLLKDMATLAASNFPDSVDTWDNPSYYLVDFLSDFPMEEIVKAILTQFDGFHLHAKERALVFLLSTEDERIFFELIEKIDQLVKNEEIIFPVHQLAPFPVLVKGILEKNLDLFHSDHYKYMFYDLLLALNSSSLETGFQKTRLLPILLQDYKIVKESYLAYNEEYRVDYVYKSWKDSYFMIRNQMRKLLNLMEYYFTPETEKELLEALYFNDSLIMTEALLVCVAKNIPIDPILLHASATSIESAEFLYWDLHRNNKEHLFPIMEGKQMLLAKGHLFSYITNLQVEEDENDKFPEDINVVDHLETENTYGQPVRYYLLSFKESECTYMAWVGGFELEDGDDSVHMWDGTYTEFIEFDSATIEQHKEKFFEDREQARQNYDSYVHYASSPKLSKWLWFFYAILITQWLKAFTEGLAIENFVFPIILVSIAGTITILQLRKNKTSKVSIVGQNLVFARGKNEKKVPLSEIRKIEYNKKHVSVHDKRNELVLQFPIAWVHYGQFHYHMREHTSHLKDAPFIEE